MKENRGEMVHLVTDQIPLLLAVVLTQELHLVWREIHRVLYIRTEREKKRTDTDS